MTHWLKSKLLTVKVTLKTTVPLKLRPLKKHLLQRLLRPLQPLRVLLLLKQTTPFRFWRCQPFVSTLVKRALTYTKLRGLAVTVKS